MSPAPNRTRRHAVLLSCAFLAASGLLIPQHSPARGSSKATSAASGDSRTLFRLLNRERARHGLRPFRRSAALDEAARWQSRDMVARGYFAHERAGGPSLAQRIRRAGYLAGARSWAIGENIAWGEGPFSTPQSIMRSWMNSLGHRANILRRRFEHVGVGLAQGIPGRSGQDGVTATTDFGARD
jgi:uncharacterized protein YkwD